jgi:hypothetical protein
MMHLHRLALRAGFVPISGRYVKQWPSGAQWSFEFDGSKPLIQDKHGRIVRDESDGITYAGMLMECLNQKD